MNMKCPGGQLPTAECEYELTCSSYRGAGVRISSNVCVFVYAHLCVRVARMHNYQAGANR